MHFTIVSYTFPPSKEIGGRRWAKFSKHLIKQGHEVTVVCSKETINLEWYKDEFPGVQFRFLSKRYPEWLSGYAKTFKEKFLYYIATRILSRFTRRNIFDRGFAWKKPMLRALEVVHSSKPIDVLVVTGAPFSLLYYGSQFKARYKQVQYIIDFRDPWTWAGFYGLASMSKVKLTYQEMSEYKSIKACDMACCITQSMVSFLKEKYPAFSSKLYLLAHAYDPEKFPDKLIVEKREGFIYGGTLYNGIENYFHSLFRILSANPDSGFKWDIYTGTNYPLLDAPIAKDCIRKHKIIPEEQLFIKMKQAAAYLVFFSKADKDIISTKFYEIVYMQIPILYVGEQGDVARFISENRLGVHILPQNLEMELPKYLSGQVPAEYGHFDVSQYTFTRITKKFLSDLKEFKPLEI